MNRPIDWTKLELRESPNGWAWFWKVIGFIVITLAAYGAGKLI